MGSEARPQSRAPPPGPVIVCPYGGFCFKCPLPSPPQVLRPVCPPPRLSRGVPDPEYSADGQGEHPAGLAKGQARKCPSRGPRHTHTLIDPGTHTHALPELDLKSADKYIEMRPPQVNADLLLPEKSNANVWTLSLPFGASTWAPLSRPVPGRSFARKNCAFPPQITTPPKCVHTKTIQAEPDLGELGPTGSSSVREMRVRTCPPSATGTTAPSILIAIPRGASGQPARPP